MAVTYLGCPAQVINDMRAPSVVPVEVDGVVTCHRVNIETNDGNVAVFAVCTTEDEANEVESLVFGLSYLR